ncbi:unnamed protein product [Symbiodinium sp. CCMP2456]|nr:unnamed protein product [Symbiodinium sp. CCMP2456]
MCMHTHIPGMLLQGTCSQWLQLQGLARSSKLSSSSKDSSQQGLEVGMAMSAADSVMIEGFLKAAEAGKLVQSIDSLHQFLVQQGLAWKQVIHCQHIGVHSENRDGLGCSSSHVHELLTSIASIGFSQQEVKGICLEVPSGAEGDPIREFNDNLIKESGNKLAPLTGMRYASIVGSHANQAARCLFFRTPHEDTRLTNDGKLSLERLESLDPAWAKSITNGHEWLVVSFQVARSFPQYVLLAQAAGNAAGQIAAVEHEVQLAKRVNASIAAFLQRTKSQSVTYQDVATEILRSRSPHAAALPSIFTFVMKCGGGTGTTSFMSKTVQRLLQGIENLESVLGDFEVELAAVVLQKKKIAKHDSIEEAATTWLQKFGVSSLRIFNEEGKLLSDSRVADLGFKSGMEVIRKADDTKGTIVDISSENVRLKMADGKMYEASAQSFVDGKWKQHVPKQEPTLFKEWATYSPVKNDELTMSVVRGLVSSSMIEQYTSMKLDQLDVFLKPSRDVQVKSSFAVHGLKLPIASSRIDFRVHGEKIPSGSFQVALMVGASSTKPSHTISVQPFVQAPKEGSKQGFLNPAWIMKCTSDYDEGNMEFHCSGKNWANQKLSSTSTSMTLPVIRNYTKLESGDSLVLYRPELAKTQEVETLQPVSKRPRK